MTRREFLKLMASLPLLKIKLPGWRYDRNSWNQTSLEANILILVFDALSARHLPIYGYERDTAPNISRFAKRATVYNNHYAAGNFTTPGTASFFTGVYPWSHHAINLHGTVAEDYRYRNFFSLMPEGVNKVVYSHNLLVTALLKQFEEDLNLFKKTRELAIIDEQYSDRLFAGDENTSFWSEGLILRGGTTPASLFFSLIYKAVRLALKSKITNEYGHLFPRGVPNLNDIYFILEDATDWIMEEVERIPSPFLGYFHFLPPHEPYYTRRDFVGLFNDQYVAPEKPEHFFSDGHPEGFLNQQRREYDEYIAYADTEFGRLMDHLEQHGMIDSTYVILTSDHGEMFERGIRGHITPTLYEPVIRVPLLISKPGQKTREDIHTPTSCVDLLPTLLSIAGQPIPEWCEGEILPTFNHAEIKSNRSIFAIEAKNNPKYGPLREGTVALIKNRYKLIHYLGYKNYESEYELYDLGVDPEEIENLNLSKASLARELIDELRLKIEEINAPYGSK